MANLKAFFRSFYQAYASLFSALSATHDTIIKDSATATNEVKS